MLRSKGIVTDDKQWYVWCHWSYDDNAENGDDQIWKWGTMLWRRVAGWSHRSPRSAPPLHGELKSPSRSRMKSLSTTTQCCYLTSSTSWSWWPLLGRRWQSVDILSNLSDQSHTRAPASEIDVFWSSCSMLSISTSSLIKIRLLKGESHLRDQLKRFKYQTYSIMIPLHKSPYKKIKSFGALS